MVNAISVPVTWDGRGEGPESINLALTNPGGARAQHPQTVLLNAVRIFTNLRDGRSANAGLLEENKRQTDWLKKIHDNTKNRGNTTTPGEAVFA